MTDHAREAAEKIVARLNGRQDDVERAAKDVQSAIDAACAERDAKIALLRKAAIWLANHSPLTPVPDWIDVAIGSATRADHEAPAAEELAKCETIDTPEEK